MQGKVVNVLAAGLDVLLCFPVSLVLLDSDINTYSSRRGGGINLESAEHGVIEVASVLGSSRSSDSCGGIILALILVFLGVAAEETSDGRNDDREVADSQSDASLEGTDDGLPYTRESDDQDGVSEGSKGGGQRTSEDGDQTESDGRGDADVPENPERSDDQEEVREGLG